MQLNRGWRAAGLALAAALATSGPARAAVAVFQGEVACRVGSSANELVSPVTATVKGGVLDLKAADPIWSMGSGKDFTRREALSHVVFEWSPRLGLIDFIFAGATAHIRVAAASDALLIVKPEGGVTICRGALVLVGGSLSEGLVR
ncbi:MAG: hypothetical protein ACT4N4_14990 [Rhodospirillales bacterium]